MSEELKISTIISKVNENVLESKRLPIKYLFLNSK